MVLTGFLIEYPHQAPLGSLLRTLAASRLFLELDLHFEVDDLALESRQNLLKALSNDVDACASDSAVNSGDEGVEAGFGAREEVGFVLSDEPLEVKAPITEIHQHHGAFERRTNTLELLAVMGEAIAELEAVKKTHCSEVDGVNLELGAVVVGGRIDLA